MSTDATGMLGAFLTATEAREIAALLHSGEQVSTALLAVNPARRDKAKQLLQAAGLSHLNAEISVPVLEAIAGAKSVQRNLTPVWTMPGNEAEVGRLTSQFHKLVEGARQSVTCATFNFAETSQMWRALKTASTRTDVQVTLYVDGQVADGAAIKQQMPRVTVFKSTQLPTGKPVVSHAKFIIIDHATLLLTSANFSYSAENQNVEFGLLIHDPSLAGSVEDVMASKQGVLYERVTG